MKFVISMMFMALNFLLNAQKGWQKDLNVANAFMEQHAYQQAVNYYNLSIQVNKTEDAITQLGLAYFQLREYNEALLAWRQLEVFSMSEEVKLNMARSEFYLGHYDNALSQLRSIEDSLLLKQSQLIIASCDSIKKWKELPVTARFRNMRAINTSASEIAPVQFDGKLVFSSDREGVIIKRNYEQTGNRFYDLYLTKKNDKNRWENPVLFSAGINSPNHEGAASFSSGGDEIYFTRSEFTQSENLNHSDENRLKLYKSELKNGRWSKPLWFMMNDSLHSFGHPCISEDGSYFFFVADLPQGFGGTDIYLSLKITDTTWSEPINLGSNVNTSENELYPFISSTEQLYFSSNGHPGYGSYDLYQTQFENGEWLAPMNMGIGINSSYDDFSLTLFNSNKGVFSSNRPGGKGREDLYIFLFE